MKVFYDCEFLEDGATIDLISIGMVREDGQELYAIAEEIQTDRDIHAKIVGHGWLMENVIPHLPLGEPPADVTSVLREVFKLKDFTLDLDHPAVLPRRVIAKIVRTFLGDNPELWAWCGAYDHVCLAQLWGPMIRLPQGIPMWTNDLRQEAHRLGNPTVPEQPADAHNALADARHLVTIDRFLAEIRDQT